MQLGTTTYRDSVYCDPSRQSGWNVFSGLFRTAATVIGTAGGGADGAAMGASVPDSCSAVWVKDLPGNVFDQRTGWSKENALLAAAFILLVSIVITRKL